MARHLATMWHWSPASVRWPWLHGEDWKWKTPVLMLQRQLTPLRRLIARAVKKSHHYLCPWIPIPLEELSGTNILPQAALASAFFLHEWFILQGHITYAPLGLHTYNTVDAILSTVWIRKIKNTGTNSRGEYIYSVGRIIGKEAETVKVIPTSALLYRRETSHVGFTLRQWNAMI